MQVKTCICVAFAEGPFGPLIEEPYFEAYGNVLNGVANVIVFGGHMKHWKYRAYDGEFKIHEGVTVGHDFLTIALELRQKGMYPLEAETIDVNKYNALRQNYARKGILHPAANESPPQRLRIHWLRRLLSWLFRRRPNIVP